MLIATDGFSVTTNVYTGITPFQKMERPQDWGRSKIEVALSQETSYNVGDKHITRYLP